jgi:putative transposase
MVDHDHSQLSVRRQCELLGVNRNRLEARKPGPMGGQDLLIARRMDELALRFPEFGARRMALTLSREGLAASRRQTARVMKKMGLEAVYRRPRTSVPAPGHKVYPYLLRDREVNRPDEVWCADITFIAMPRGYAYLVAIMDWQSRAVLGWQLSNTLETGFCVEALQQACQKTGRTPEIFNTDQGCQFTSREWIGALEQAGVRVSMDGRGRWMDNVFIERLWRSVKHEGVYLWAYDDLHELEKALERWFADYNHFKPHQTLDGKTPWEAYRPEEVPQWRLAA